MKQTDKCECSFGINKILIECEHNKPIRKETKEVLDYLNNEGIWNKSLSKDKVYYSTEELLKDAFPKAKLKKYWLSENEKKIIDKIRRDNYYSHSQTERNGCSEKDVKELKYANTSQNVRASEEGITKEEKSTTFSPFSMPCTPLTDDMIYLFPSRIISSSSSNWILKDDVLSALNGYLDDISGHLPHGKDYVIAKELLEKWFPILDEVEKE